MRLPEIARIPALAVSALCLLHIYFAGCSEDTVEPELPLDTGPQETSTWEVIQNRVLNEACVGCHISGSSFARQSNLVLTSDVAYSQLIGRAPHNQAARDDGMQLVGTGGLASLAKSFLWEKINAPNQEHFFADHPQYGGMMPLGLPSLTNGELAYIKQWIIAKAPADSHVVDRVLLKDTSRYEPPEFQPMDPPVSGFQLNLGPFTVAPNFERELFYYVPLGNTEDVFVQRTEIRIRNGSHHFILYRFGDDTPLDMIPDPNVIRDIRDPSGNYIVANLLATQYHRFLLGTQWPLMNYTFPTGVALRLPADSGLDLNSHFVNRSNTPFDGEVVVNLHTVPPEQVQHVAEALFLNHDEFSLPPQQVTTESKVFLFDERRYFFQLMSHAHEHMTEFRVYVSGGPLDGELVYIAYDWEHPPILELNPPLILEAGQGLRLETTYNNTTNRTLRFGLLSEDEMMILFGAYYTD